MSSSSECLLGPASGFSDNVLIRSFSHLEGAEIASGASLPVRPAAGPARCLRRMSMSAISSRSGVAPRRRRQGQPPLPILATATSGREPISGATLHDHLQLRRLQKFRTIIGERAFIGSNSALVAPVRSAMALTCDRQRRHFGCSADALDDRAAGRSTSRGAPAALRAQLKGKQRLMCGIIGIIAKNRSAAELIEGCGA